MLARASLCCLLVLGLATPGTLAAFGDPMDHGTDDLFELMGQARVDEFKIEKGQVYLDVALEDTEGQDEVWILDFEEFQHNNKSEWAVVQDDGGKLVAENTGSCSSVFKTVAYDPVSGFYKDSFSPDPPGNKSLFNSYQTSGQHVQKGDIKVREDHVMFDGTIDTMFDCKNSKQENVWHKEVTPETIQFNTTLYMTNVRPQGTSSNPEPAYVQSFAVLYWRLLRVALSRFLISSTERLRPIFEYATVRPVYLNDDEEYGFDRARAEVEIAFRTITAHPNGSLISVYDANSLVYDPAALLTNNKLSHIKKTPSRGCEKPLGVESGAILDGQISESSMWLNSEEYSAAKGRLNAQPVDAVSAGAWLAGSADLLQWIQVDLLNQMWVSGVLTQGYIDGQGINLWVTKYQISYSTAGDGTLTTLVDESNAPIDFDANYDGQTIVANYFGEPILARRIRISPQEWDNSIAMRFELLGCEVHTECYTDSTGADYRGTVSVTNTGLTCQRWSTQEPHTHSYTPEDYASSGIGDHNFCRNVGGSEQPWCYTIDSNVPYGNCSVGAPQVSCTTDVSTNLPEDSFANYAPHCNFTEYENYCTQRWIFIIILEVDTEGATNRMPIDATGEFTFEFETYSCPNNDRTVCRKLEIPNAIVSNEITLQTTVEVVDDVKDSPRVYLKTVHGWDPTVDIRGGVQPGVSHLEEVTVDMHFFPLFLRNNLELELTLFMVCIGSEYLSGTDGCLTAPPEDSYSAYISPDFFYRMYTNPEDLLQFTDFYADDLPAAQQSLDSHSYIHADEIHRTKFTNKALSAQSREYTITSVFRLVERTERRKRGIARRDIKDKINNPILIHHTILFSGCPPNSTHDQENLACVCINKGEEYSEETFQCQKSRPAIINEEKRPAKENGESPMDSSDSGDGHDDDSGSTSLLPTAPLVHASASLLMLIALLI